MRSTLRSLALASFTFALAASALAGCAAPTSEDDVGASEGAQTSDPRASIRAATKTAVLWEAGQETAALQPKKLDAIMASFAGGKAKLAAGRPRCMPSSSVTFFDAEGTQLGVLSSYEGCGASAYLAVGAKTFLVPVAHADLAAAFAGAQSIGELLHGADELVRDGQSTKEPDAVATWIRGFDPLAMPVLAPEPDHGSETLSFVYRKKGKELASVVVYTPQDDKTTKAPALVSVGGEKVGFVELDVLRALGGGGF